MILGTIGFLEMEPHRQTRGPIKIPGFAAVIRLRYWANIAPKHVDRLRIHPRACPWYSAKADNNNQVQLEFMGDSGCLTLFR
jgi:hypothetical protein